MSVVSNSSTQAEQPPTHTHTHTVSLSTIAAYTYTHSHTHTHTTLSLSCCTAVKTLNTLLSPVNRNVRRRLLSWLWQGAEDVLLMTASVHQQDAAGQATSTLDHLLHMDTHTRVVDLVGKRLFTHTHTHTHYGCCYFTTRLAFNQGFKCCVKLTSNFSFT
jgi:hypothetical protein